MIYKQSIDGFRAVIAIVTHGLFSQFFDCCCRYVGEKLQRFGMVKKRKKGAIISTVYDDVEETDPAELLLRRNEPYGLKHRPSHIRFMKASLRPSDIL